MEKATKILVMATLASTIIFIMTATLAVLVVRDLVNTMGEEIEDRPSVSNPPAMGARSIPSLEESNPSEERVLPGRRPPTINLPP